MWITTCRPAHSGCTRRTAASITRFKCNAVSCVRFCVRERERERERGREGERERERKRERERQTERKREPPVTPAQAPRRSHRLTGMLERGRDRNTGYTSACPARWCSWPPPHALLSRASLSPPAAPARANWDRRHRARTTTRPAVGALGAGGRWFLRISLGVKRYPL